MTPDQKGCPSLQSDGPRSLALLLVLPPLDPLNEISDTLLALNSVDPLLHARQLSQLVGQDVPRKVETLLVFQGKLDGFGELGWMSRGEGDKCRARCGLLLRPTRGRKTDGGMRVDGVRAVRSREREVLSDFVQCLAEG